MVIFLKFSLFVSCIYQISFKCVRFYYHYVIAPTQCIYVLRLTTCPVL